MIKKTLLYAPEIIFTLGMMVIMATMSFYYGLPILLPSGERAAFVGIHYLYPLIGVAIWGIVALVGQRRQLARTFFVALPCYAIMIWIYFNIKLWVPHINPITFDHLYWNIDQFFRPIIETMFVLRGNVFWFFPKNGNIYMFGFILLFYISFCYHAIMTPEAFRKLFLAALFFQGLGALAYIPFPALGPFIYERGMNDLMTGAQMSMWSFHKEIVAHDPSWLAIEGPANITAGLGAMPSLHVGGAFLFFIFAWKYARILLPLYAVMLSYILIAAVTTRWHYLIDLPFGMLLALVSAWAAEKCTSLKEENPAPRVQGELGMA